jgi:hypothetical protein
MKLLLKNILLLIIIIALVYFTAYYFGALYSKIFPNVLGGSWIGSSDSWQALFGLPLAYIFFLTLLFTALGDSKKYWWIGILLIPAVIFEVAFDMEHIYIPIILGLLGWAIGYGLSRLIPQKLKV